MECILLNFASLFVFHLIRVWWNQSWKIDLSAVSNIHRILTHTVPISPLQWYFKTIVPTDLFSWDHCSFESQEKAAASKGSNSTSLSETEEPHYIFSFFNLSSPLALLAPSLSVYFSPFLFSFSTVHHCGFIHFMFSETPQASQHKATRCRKSLIS